MNFHPGTTADELIDEHIRRWLSRNALPDQQIRHARVVAGGYGSANILLVNDTGNRDALHPYLHRNTCAVDAVLAERLVGMVPVADIADANPDGKAASRPAVPWRFMPGD